jgi:hypothetical protein
MSASKITKVWTTGDDFLASDQESINKGTINSVIDDNTEFHVLKSGSTLNSIENNISSATGVGSVALGLATVVSGQYSLAVGDTNEITNNNSLCIGQDNFSSGQGNFVNGFDNYVTGNQSVAIGNSNHISGANSMAVGDNHTITTDETLACNNLIISDIAYQSTDSYVVLALDPDGKVKKYALSTYAEYHNYAQDLGATYTESATYVDGVRINTPSGMTAGVYEIDFSLVFYTRYADTRLEVQIIDDGIGGGTLWNGMIYPSGAGSSFRTPMSGKVYLSISDTTTHIIKLQYRVGDNVDDCNMYNTSISMIQRSTF